VAAASDIFFKQHFSLQHSRSAPAEVVAALQAAAFLAAALLLAP
jgi:hypothetical protein